MHFFMEQLLSNYPLMTAVLSWFVAQVLKTAIDAYFNKGINWERMTGSGGMPSSHSSTVVSLAVAIGVSYGVDSTLFALALIFAIVVMYDATGVRRETGKQAVILNRLLLDNPFSWTGEEFDKKLKEYVGHTPLQVLMGAILGVLIALSSSLLGVTLVLKRYSYIGDGLSHVAFGAMSIATVLKLSNQMVLILPVTIVCAVLLLRTGQNSKIKGDAAIAMLSVGALAFGYLVMNVFSTSANLSGDVCSTLFGSTSILTLTSREVQLCAALSFLVVCLFIVYYQKIFAVTFDENFARASGTDAGRYNLLIAITVAVIIVLAMNLVGSLLISALVIFPALSAMRLFHDFKSVTVCSALLSVTCALLGILASIRAGTPVGSTIVAADAIAFGLCSLIAAVQRRKTA